MRLQKIAAPPIVATVPRYAVSPASGPRLIRQARGAGDRTVVAHPAAFKVSTHYIVLGCFVSSSSDHLEVHRVNAALTSLESGQTSRSS